MTKHQCNFYKRYKAHIKLYILTNKNTIHNWINLCVPQRQTRTDRGQRWERVLFQCLCCCVRHPHRSSIFHTDVHSCAHTQPQDTSSFCDLTLISCIIQNTLTYPHYMCVSSTHRPALLYCLISEQLTSAPAVSA